MSPNEAVKLNQRQLPWVKCKGGGGREREKQGKRFGLGGEKKQKEKYEF